MSRFLRALNAIFRTGRSVSILQIGAADGITMDHLFEFVVRDSCTALLVEPVDDLFQLLAERHRNRPNVVCENAAIWRFSGEVDIHRVPLAAVSQGLVPAWAFGISSLYNDRNSIGGIRTSESDYNCIKNHVTTERVKCLTLDALLYKHGVRQFDVVYIDAEGSDFLILDQVDFGEMQPAIVCLEISNLPSDEKEKAEIALLAAEYNIFEEGDYLLGIKASKFYDRREYRRSILFYCEPNWALGAIHDSLCHHLRSEGWRAEILDWGQSYLIHELQRKADEFDLIVTLPFAGSAPLTESYGIPPEKIALIAHAESDVQKFIVRYGVHEFQKYAGFAVVSDTLFASCIALGVPAAPTVLKVGVEFERFARDVPECLKTVGYASAYTTFTPSGLNLKRGVLAKAVSHSLGLDFAVAKGRNREGMYNFYSEVDAILMPSLLEGAGLPPLEAAASGRLVVGTPVGHFPRLAYEDLGWMAPLNPRDFVKFCREILSYYVNNRAAFQEQCLSCQNHSRSRDWKNVICDWKDFFSGCF